MGALHTPFPLIPPLTARVNPQRDFFEAPPVSQSWSTCCFLGAELWHQQKGRLAMYARDQRRREQARGNPPPATRPQVASYDWAWPSAMRLAVSEAQAYASPDPSVSPDLQCEPQQEALADLLQEIGQHFGFALSRPCPVYTDGHSTRIELLDCVAWVRLPGQRRLQLELRDADGTWQLSTLAFDVSHPLRDGSWIWQALLPWAPHIEAAFGEAAFEAHYWLRQKLQRHFIDASYLDAAERQIVHHLDLQPDLGRAAVLLARHGRALGANSDTYNLMWAGERFWLRLCRHQAHLVPFCALAAAKGLIGPGDDLGELRVECLRRGMSPAGWRFLCRHGEAACAAIYRFAGRFATSWPDVLIACVEWQARAGLREPLPPHYAAAVVSAYCLRRRTGGRVEVAVDPRVARALADAGLPNRGEPNSGVPLSEWLDTLDWLRLAKPRLDRNQWRTGWPVIRRLQRQWSDRRKRLRWESALGPFTMDRWAIRPLTGGPELIAEGKRMRHCVADYIDACHEGRYRVFTVERPETGEPVATIGLKCLDRHWILDQVRGKRNEEVGAELERIAWALLRRHDQRRTATTMLV